MADWRQIQARIRRAKKSSDPFAKLSELFEKTRDAMVAFELGATEEKAGHNSEAIRWYSAAAERFRRADWKTRAGEALARLGAPPAAGEETSVAAGETTEPAAPVARAAARELSASAPPPSVVEALPLQESAPAKEPAAGRNVTGRRRRRGRRGGRRHRRGGATALPSLPAQSFAPPIRSLPPTAEAPAPVVEQPVRSELAPALASAVERPAHGRAGEPALASRLAQLESLLRRLISSPLHRPDEADEAPAGPGVFLLSDSDLTTNYYVEACQTLRVGLGQLVRGGRASRAARGARSAPALRAEFAEHLGISESKVSDYLKHHCVIRWLQLDEDAPHLAHFAIAVLRTPLNGE